MPQAQVKPETVKKSVTVEGEDEDDFTHVGKGGKATQYTAEGIYKTLQAIQEARGKKVRPSTVPALSMYRDFHRTPIVRIKFVFWNVSSTSLSRLINEYVFCWP